MEIKPEKHTREWCDEKKKTCKDCAKTNFYCKRHEPWVTSKSAKSWGGMHHQAKCPFYLALTDKDKTIAAFAVVRYCATVQVDFVEQPDFNGYDMKCPDCKGWDVTVRKHL